MIRRKTDRFKAKHRYKSEIIKPKKKGLHISHYSSSKVEDNRDEHVIPISEILEPSSNGQQAVFPISFPSKLKHPKIIKEKERWHGKQIEQQK